MLAKKLIACFLIFCLLLTGGWLIDRQLSKQSIPRKLKIENGIQELIIHSANQPRPFRPREYVRIVRSPTR